MLFLSLAHQDNGTVSQFFFRLCPKFLDMLQRMTSRMILSLVHRGLSLLLFTVSRAVSCGSLRTEFVKAWIEADASMYADDADFLFMMTLLSARSLRSSQLFWTI
jgi:hypothetical protein